MNIFRQEHPNPQWQRENWRNLNGEWEFDFDFGKTARERQRWQEGALPHKICVPFCPESELSGIGYTDFMQAVCYRKIVTLTKSECTQNVILHFGAVDYESFIYVNGTLACQHIGGYTSFEVDITEYVREGENVIFVIAEDDVRSGRQPGGKQSAKYSSYGCFYTRTTGIWQTVWLEFVPKAYIKSARYETDIQNACVKITGYVCGSGLLSAHTFFNGKSTGTAQFEAENGFFEMRIALHELHLWELGKGGLYDLELSFNDDTIKSYFGMREQSKIFIKRKLCFSAHGVGSGVLPGRHLYSQNR